MILPIASRREVLATLRPLLGRHPGLLLLVVAVGLLTAAAGLVGPWVVGDLVDRLRSAATLRPVLLGGGAVLLAGLVGAVGTWLGQRWMAALAEPAVDAVRRQVLDAALALDTEEIERGGRGDLVSRVAEDSRVLTQAASVILPMVLQSLFVVLVSAVGLAAVDWRLGLVGLLAIPLYASTLRWYLPRSGPIYAAERVAFGARAQRMLGGLGGHRTLRAFEAERTELDRIDAASARARDLSIDVFRFLTRAFSRNNRAEAVVLTALLVVGFLLVDGGSLSAGDVATAALLFHRLFNPIGALVGMFDEVQSAGASLARMVGVVELAAAPRPGSGTATVLATDPGEDPDVVLSLRGVGHAYEAGHPVLEEVDLALRRGEVVAVVGATGAGKSTLAQIAAGTVRPTSGAAVSRGTPVPALPREELRRRIAMVSQEVHVFGASIAENVRLPRPGASAEEVTAALRTVGAEGWVRRLPEGADTVVGEGAHRLTATQEQMLALARVALADPELVVLDEATAEAGSAGARELEAAASAVLAGRSALVVAHRLSQAASADRVLVMAGGRVVEDGTHDALRQGTGPYAELWRAWTAR